MATVLGEEVLHLYVGDQGRLVAEFVDRYYDPVNEVWTEDPVDLGQAQAIELHWRVAGSSKTPLNLTPDADQVVNTGIAYYDFGAELDQAGDLEVRGKVVDVNGRTHWFDKETGTIEDPAL